MPKHFLSAVWVFLIAAAMLQEDAPAAPAKGDPRNATTIYQRAIDRLPKAETVDAEFLRDPESAPLEDPLVRFLMTHDDTAQLLHQGTLLDRCEWPDESDPRQWATLSSLLKNMQRLADLERLRIRYFIEQQRFDESMTENEDLLVLARRLGRIPLIEGRLAGAELQERAITDIATALPAAADKSLAQMKKRLDTLPRWTTAGEVVTAHGKTVANELKKYDVPKPPDVVAKGTMLAELTGGDEPQVEVQKQIKALWQDPGKRLAGMVEVTSGYEEAAKIIAMPRLTVGTALEAFEKKRQAGSILEKTVVPSGAKLDQLRVVALTSEVRTAMAQAAVVGRVSGTEEAMKILDPSTNKPFILREWEEGFELKSDLGGTAAKKPLVLVVGKPEKPTF